MSGNDAVDRIDIIDGLRGIAIGMVLLFHAYIWLPPVPKIWGIDFLYPLSMGYIGVQLFFVISGFCMYYAWAKKSAQVDGFRYGDYFRRRFWRIYPPYFVALLLTIPASILWRGWDYAWSAFAWHLPFLHVFFYNTDYFYGANPALWSIAVEVQFYLFFPLIMMVANRWGLARVVAVLFALTLAYSFYISQLFPSSIFGEIPAPYLNGVLLAHLPCFAVGIVLAGLWTGRQQSFLGVRRARHANGARWLLLGGLILMALTWFSIFQFRHSSIVWREFGFALSFGLLVFGALHAGPWNRILSNSWIFGLGTISYSVFLNHAPIWQMPLLFLSENLQKGPLYWWTLFALDLCVGLPIALLLSWEFHRLVEKPSIRLAHGRTLLLKRIAGVGREADKVAVSEQKMDTPETVINTAHTPGDGQHAVGDVAHASPVI